MGKLEITLDKSWTGESYFDRIITGTSVIVNTNIAYYVGDDTDNMCVEVKINEETGRVEIDIFDMPPNRTDPSLNRRQLHAIITVLQVAEQVAEQMEEAIKDVDPTVLAQYREALNKLNDEDREAQKRRGEEKRRLNETVLANYIRALGDKEYTINVVNDAEVD